MSNAGEIPFKIDRDVNMRLQFDMEEMPDIIGDKEIYVNEEYVRYRMQMIGNICIIRPIPVQFPEVLQGTGEA